MCDPTRAAEARPSPPRYGGGAFPRLRSSQTTALLIKHHLLAISGLSAAPLSPALAHPLTHPHPIPVAAPPPQPRACCQGNQHLISKVSVCIIVFTLSSSNPSLSLSLSPSLKNTHKNTYTPHTHTHTHTDTHTQTHTHTSSLQLLLCTLPLLPLCPPVLYPLYFFS